MVAITDREKARLLDLTTSVLELVRDGRRDVGEVCELLQRVKDGKAAGVKCLRPAGVHLPARTEPFDPKEFFQSREGLFVWREFTDRILVVAESVETVPETTVASFDLVRPANDAEIRGELPKNHVFEASAFSAYLASMIQRQPKGEEGYLLSNDYANIFYVRGVGDELFAVCVNWRSHDREWGVYCGPFDNDLWDGGYRAFSSNC